MEIQTTGTIHGQTIELDSTHHFIEGQRVEVIVTPLSPAPPVWGDGIRKSAGAMADDPDFERIMDEVQQMRKRDRPGASF